MTRLASATVLVRRGPLTRLPAGRSSMSAVATRSLVFRAGMQSCEASYKVQCVICQTRRAVMRVSLVTVASLGGTITMTAPAGPHGVMPSLAADDLLASLPGLPP